jgi:hypothetical protein
MSADYIRAVPTINLTDDELAAVTAAIRRAIEDDRFPHAPRLDPLRAVLGKFEAASGQPRFLRSRRQSKTTSALGDERSLNGRELMADTWKLTFTDVNGRVDTNTYDNETAFISAVYDKLNDLHHAGIPPDGSQMDEKALGV